MIVPSLDEMKPHSMDCGTSEGGRVWETRAAGHSPVAQHDKFLIKVKGLQVAGHRVARVSRSASLGLGLSRKDRGTSRTGVSVQKRSSGLR